MILTTEKCKSSAENQIHLKVTMAKEMMLTDVQTMTFTPMGIQVKKRKWTNFVFTQVPKHKW